MIYVWWSTVVMDNCSWFMFDWRGCSHHLVVLQPNLSVLCEEFESKDGILKGCDLIKLLSMLSCDTQVWSHVLVMLD